MRYRRFGRSDLEVSEVGFGVWTLASDWWGRIDDPRDVARRPRCRDQLHRHRAGLWRRRCRRDAPRRLLKSDRSEIVLTTKCGYDIDSPRPESQSERRQDWQPASVRAQLEASLRRLGTEYIDLYQLHNARLDPIHDDALWEELEKFRVEGKVRELGVALGPAIGWVEEGLDSLRERPIVRCRPCSTCSSRNPASRSRPNRGRRGEVGLISRVPHASDTLSGKITRDTEFPPGDHRAHRNRENMLDNFDKAETLAFLWEGHRPHDRTGRDRRDPRQPVLHDRAPHVRVDRGRAGVRGRIRPSAHRRRAAQLDERWHGQLRRHATATRCR